MKLDSKAMRHLTAEDWRVLAAVEMGSKNHEIVPLPLIEKLARLRGGAGSTRRSISALAKVGLISLPRDGGRTGGGKTGYAGYRLTYGGLDYLALRAHSQRGSVYSVGTRIGVGKESDIMAVADDRGVQRVLKIHRLGRISFRTVRQNRDYLNKKGAGGGGRGKGDNSNNGSWMYLSRLAAEREYAFMRALREEGFRVPEPLGQSRHTVLMELVEDALPLRQVSAVGDPAALYAELIAVILRLARHGLIHGDFNEFNILLREDKVKTKKTTEAKTDPHSEASDEQPQSQPQQEQELEEGEEETLTATPIIIDFPQMVSMDHVNAEMYFDRDVACVKRFFSRRFHFEAQEPGPFFRDAKALVGRGGARRLDAAVEASGFTKKMLRDLEAAIRAQQEEKGVDYRGGEDYDEAGGLSDYDDDQDEDDEDDGGVADDADANEENIDEGESRAEGETDNPPRIDMSKLSVQDDT
ncbi:Serine/threonine-protein kinase rio2 [Diatrype stigma]|uniref:non-specific serine/threonine protein kinase n=1 Tax=Diatrype stigma TaxID=117547 RepID=A0AAN9UWI2_9PEZI